MSGAEELGRRVIDYMSVIGSCETQGQLERAASTECGRVGITALASGMVTGPKSTSGNPFHFTTWPETWMRLYRERRWVEHDPVPRYAVVSGLPITWSALMRDLPATDAGHAIYLAAKAHDFHEGYVTPVRTGDGHLGLVSVATDRTNLPPAHCHFLQAVSTATLHRAEAIRRGAARAAVRTEHPPSFSPRERQCLALLVQGHTDREIGSLLGITESTARFHVDNARIKAGARSRVHLAGTAAQWIGAPSAAARPGRSGAGGGARTEPEGDG